MKSILKSGLFAILSAVMCFATTSQTFGQGTDLKPALVVSIASIDELLADIGYVSRTSGTPEIGGTVSIIAAQYIEGLNTKRPIGAYVSFDDGQPGVVTFLPVNDFNKVLEVVKRNLGEPEPAGGGVLKLRLNQDIYLKERGGWVFVSNSMGRLVNVPSDPSVLLEKLHETYDVAVRVNLQNVPANLRDTALSEIKLNIERRMREESNSKDREAQEKFAANFVKGITSFVEESDRITIGFGIDAAAKSTFLDVALTALNGTDMAKQMATLAKTQSQFTGFGDANSAVTLNYASVLTPDQIRDAKASLTSSIELAIKQINEGNQKQGKEVAIEAIQLFAKAVEKTIETGKLDGAASIDLSGGSLRLIGGAYVADTASVETALKKLVEAAKADPKFPGVKFDAVRHGSIRFHTIAIPIPEHEEQARKTFGDNMDVAIGIGDKSLFIALGPDSIAMAKSAIDVSMKNGSKPVSPMSLAISLASVFEFASKLDQNPVLPQLAKTLKASNGRDHINASMKSIDNGVRARIELEDGLLKAVGQAIKMQQGR